VNNLSKGEPDFSMGASVENVTAQEEQGIKRSLEDITVG
jgi:hypothetical protein